MPGTPTTIWGIPVLAGADQILSIDDWSAAAMGAIDGLLAPSPQALLSAIPAAGKVGRTYYATDTKQLFRDNGSAWIEVTDLGYRSIRFREAILNARPSTTRPFTGKAPVSTGSLNTPPGGDTGWSIFYLDPARYAVGGRTGKLAVWGIVESPATPPGCDFTFDLRPVTPTTGLTSPQMDVTLGAAVSGSAAVVSSPPANSYRHAESSDFTFPTAGFYALCVTNSASTPDNVFLSVELALRVI